MRILHTVQRYAPDTGGSEEVVRQLSERLAAQGHEVTVATGFTPLRKTDVLNSVRIAQFRCSGNDVEGITGEVERYRGFIREFPADVMMNYAGQIWSSDAVFPLLPSLRCKKVFVPCGYSHLRMPAYAPYYRDMPEVLTRYDRAVYLSENYIDKRFADQHGLTNSVVIPNAADLDEFHAARPGDFRRKYRLGDRKIILNVSNHSTLKGHDFFWDVVRALKGDGVVPVLIGNTFRQGAAKWVSQCYAACRLRAATMGGLVLEGVPRADVVNAYVDATAFVFGSRVECSPLVMFESFAAGALFVTTNCGNVSDHRDVACVVGNEHEAVDILRDFLSSPGHYEARLRRGRDLVRNRLNWGAVARQYELLYRELLS